MSLQHQIPSASDKPRVGLLVSLARIVLEAALEAELIEHLACQDGPARPGRRNARNGTRSKTVRSLVGPVTLEVPRDRWGTFAPMTVGKWQREVVGVDRVLFPLAAKGAPTREIVALLAQAYPPDAPERTLRRIVTMAQARLEDWHERTFEAPYPVLHVHMSTLRTPDGRSAGFPVLSVIGASAPDAHGRQRRELLSIHALPAEGGHEPWLAVVSDLRRRELSGVTSVVGSAAVPFRAAVAHVWPAAS